MPLSMTWKKNAPSPEVSRTAAGRWNKIFGDRLISSHRHLAVGKLEDLESWCYDEIHGSFTHGVIFKKIPPKNPSNATIQGKSPQKKKFTIQICIKFGFSPKKMGNKKWSRTSHPPVFKKKLYIPPNLEEIESFPEKKKHAQSKSYNLWCAAKCGLQVLVGTWEHDPLVASSKKGVSPQRAIRQNLRNTKDSDHKTICKIQQRRTSFVFFHIAQTQKKIMEWIKLYI